MARTRPISIGAAIIQSRRSAPTLGHLMETTGLGRVAVEEMIRRAELAGLVEPWPETDAVSLSPLGAERLRVRIGPRGWIDIEAKGRPERVNPERVLTVTEADLIAADARNRMDQVPDRTPSAEAMLAELEAHEAAVARRAGVGSRRRPIPPVVPRFFVASGLQWPVQPTGRGCGACAGLTLRLAEGCLICDRIGTDAYQPARPGGRKKKRRPEPPRRPRLSALAELLIEVGLAAARDAGR